MPCGLGPTEMLQRLIKNVCPHETLLYLGLLSIVNLGNLDRNGVNDLLPL